MKARIYSDVEMDDHQKSYDSRDEATVNVSYDKRYRSKTTDRLPVRRVIIKPAFRAIDVFSGNITGSGSKSMAKSVTRFGILMKMNAW